MTSQQLLRWGRASPMCAQLPISRTDGYPWVLLASPGITRSPLFDGYSRPTGTRGGPSPDSVCFWQFADLSLGLIFLGKQMRKQSGSSWSSPCFFLTFVWIEDDLWPLWASKQQFNKGVRDAFLTCRARPLLFGRSCQEVTARAHGRSRSMRFSLLPFFIHPFCQMSDSK